MIWRRTLLLLVLTVTGLALESSLLGTTTLAGTKPELLLLVTVALAMSEGPLFGTIAGFAMGLATDLLLGLPQGVTALTYTVAGYTVGRVRATLQTPSPWLPIVMVSITTLAAVLFYAAFGAVLGVETVPPLRVLRHAALAALYNALLTPFVFPFIRRLASVLRPRAAEVIR